MRTRLDEIVDDVLRGAMLGYAVGRDQALEMVNLAFLHGAEQERVWWTTKAGIPRTPAVQPAPAEEKRTYGWANSGRCICYGGRPVGEHYCACVCHPDRRKGERRKMQWWTNVAVCREHGYIVRYETVKYPPNDRRSGKSRRANDGATK